MAFNDSSEGGLGKQNPWPERYRVIIQDRAGNQYPYNATTWLSEAKAVAPAAQQHLQRFTSTSDERADIYDVRVESLWAAPTSGNGTAKVDPSDLIDRLEW
jgi:hypothetical protein